MKNILLLLALHLFIPPGPAAGSAQVEVIIDYPSISPNGDGIRDSSRVRVTLSETFDSLTVTLRDEAETQILDTLISRIAPDSGSYSALWDGRDSLGNTLAEGIYVLRIRAVHPDTLIYPARDLVVDVTPPIIGISMIEPGIYSPEGPQEEILIYYTVAQSSQGSEATMIVTSPDSNITDTDLEAEMDGSYVMQWTPSNPISGIYTVKLLIQDPAGNYSFDQGQVEVDADPPEVFFTTFVSSSTNQPPSSISGKVFDAGEIETLSFIWNDSNEIFPSESYTSEDTLYWTVEIIDSIYSGGEYIDGSYSLEAMAWDNFTQKSSKKISFEIDLTPPPPPALAEPASSVMIPQATITYQYDLDPDTDEIIFYRLNQGDTATSTAFAANPAPVVELGQGANEIWSVASDKAGNQSEPSNHIYISYDTSARSEFPEAWRTPGKFRVSTSRSASKVTADLFDLSGEKVTSLVDFGPKTYFELDWNLTSRDGEDVRNGAYLVIITTYYGNEQHAQKHFIAVVR